MRNIETTPDQSRRERAVRLTVNGRAHTLIVERRTSLLDAARRARPRGRQEAVRPRGVHHPRWRTPHPQLSTLACESQHLRLETIEGLGGDGLHHVQRAFIAAEEIDARTVSVADPVANHVGVKGIAEAPIVPTAPTIANAVFHALGSR